MSCILPSLEHTTEIDLIWARPAVLAAGKGRGGMFFSSISSLSFIFLFLRCPSLSVSFIISSPFLWEMTQNDPQGLMCR